MTQALYAHMNNKTIKIKKKKVMHSAFQNPGQKDFGSFHHKEMINI
jgi:hypothetical protein